MNKLNPRWKNLFNQTILSRGRDYFNNNQVHFESVEEKYLEAKVGHNEYDVFITLKQDNVQTMYCTCPFARNNNCKHEAAVLFAYEDRYNKSHNNDKKETINPFKEDFKDKKQYYFNLYKLTKHLEFDKHKLEEAQKLIDNKEIELSELNTGFTRYSLEKQSLFVKASFKNNYRNLNVQAIINKDKIEEFICSDYTCRDYSGYGFFYYEHTENLCKHKIALLLLLKDFILKNNPGDYTNANGSEFINSFENLNYQNNEEVIKEEIQLIPKLEYNQLNMLKLGFKIGVDKLYIAKKFNDLVTAKNNKDIYTLGTKDKIDFSKQDFDEKSKAFYKMIENVVNDEINRQSIREKDYNAPRDSKYFNINNSILLYGSRLDEFFNLACGQQIEMNNKNSSNKNKIGIIEGNPKLSLTISPLNKDNEFVGIEIDGTKPRVIEGGTNTYCFDENNLYKVDKEFSNIINSLQKGSIDDSVNIQIGKKKLSRFYNRVLPILKDKIEIIENNQDILELHVPVKPIFDYYFDVENGYITCDVKVSYAEETYSLFDVDPLNEKRDYFEEKEVAYILNDYFKDYNDKHLLSIEASDDVIYEILEDLIPELIKTGNVHSTDAFDRLKVKRKIQTSIGVSIDNNLLELDISTDDMSLEELSQVINSYRLKKRYHKLKSGELIRVDDENIESLDNLLNSLNISLKDFVKGKINIPSYRALYLDKLLVENNNIYDQRDVYFKRLIKNFKTLSESEYEAPKSLAKTMRNYQKEGFKWLKTLSSFNFGGILADEMGLGKTLQMITLLLDYKQENKELSALVICPTSLIYNWLAEIEKFAPSLKAIAVAGSQKERKGIINKSEKYDILVTSYELLRRDVDLYQDKEFIFEILDEAQYIKTATTANAKTCKVIKAQKRFALTGTPIENNLSELWSIFDYLMPGFLFTHEKFKQRFESRIVKEEDKESSEQLKQMVSPFILRRKKVDVLSDLPEKIEETIKVKFDDVQQKLYDSQVLKISKTINESSEENFTKNKIAILAELTKIRQICCEPSLLFDDYDGDSAKKQACIETIKNAVEEGHKILLFSQFTSMLEILEKQLEKEDIDYYKITGQTNKEDRLKLVDRFNNNDVPVFLISLKAGGTGLNLTGADIVIHYDPWWNVAAQNQATDRTHRIGQDKVVTVYKIIAQNTIEEKILELQDKKAELAESILNSESTSIASLSKEELMDLLSIK